MSKHEAEPTTTTRLREHQAAALAKIGQQRPGFGKHRATAVPADYMPEDAA